MSNRFVRQSKYRHVHGVAAKKEKAFQGAKILTQGEGGHITANTKYWAAAMGGGGGPVIVHEHNKITRLDHNHPRLNVHKQPVVDMEFSPFKEQLLATASEDATIRLSLLPEEEMTKDLTTCQVTLEGHQKKVNLIKFHPSANNVLGSIGFDNLLKVWDVEVGKEMVNYDQHTDLPQSLDWNEDGSLIATCAKDRTVRIFDPRNPATAVKGPGFEGAKGARVAWVDNHHGFLCCVGFNKSSTRQYTLFDPKKMDTPVSTTDIDQGASVMLPFYDRDTSILYLLGKGDASIKYYEVVDEEPFVYFISDFRDNESIKGGCFLPKRMLDVKSCEIALCYRVMKEWVAPVSFQVPRKSDMFQADIFPDCFAGVPAMSAEEWMRGENKVAPKKSMKPGSSGISQPAQALERKEAPVSHAPAPVPAPAPAPAPAASVSAAAPVPAPAAAVIEKTNEQLRTELDAANARIKELEQEVLHLKKALGQ